MDGKDDNIYVGDGLYHTAPTRIQTAVERHGIGQPQRRNPRLPSDIDSHGNDDNIYVGDGLYLTSPTRIQEAMERHGALQPQQGSPSVPNDIDPAKDMVTV